MPGKLKQRSLERAFPWKRIHKNGSAATCCFLFWGNLCRTGERTQVSRCRVLMHSSLHPSAAGYFAVTLLLTHWRAPLSTTRHDGSAPSNSQHPGPLCRPRQRQPPLPRAMLPSRGCGRGSVHRPRAHSRHQHPNSQVTAVCLML